MMSDDVETAQTVAYMEELASFDAGERSVIAATCRALAEAGIDATAEPAAIAEAFFAWLKRTIRYVPTPGTSAVVDQTLIAPSALLAMKDPEGDCPQFSMLAAAMFRICCIPCYFKTIAAERSMPDVFSHIYNVVAIAPGRLMPFDSSNGPAAGAEYARPFKSRVWPHTIPDACRIRPAKGNVIMMRNGQAPRGYRNRGLRGTMGDVNCDQDGNCYDDSTGTFTVAPPDVSTLPDLGVPTVALPASFLPTASGSPAAPVGTSTGFLSTLATDLTSLAAPIVKAATAQKPYYITNAQGQQVLYNPATGQTVSGLSAVFSSPSAPLFIGVAIVAIIILGKK